MKRLLLLFCLALPLSAQTQYTITPNHGPVAGGTQVTIKGSFGQWPYGVIFGSTHVPATRVDEQTLVATTPAHLPGVVTVTIFEYDIGISTDLTFTFEGNPEDAFERLLLPLYVHPIQGAFGSEFHTDFTARLESGEPLNIHGLRYPCIVTCIPVSDQPYLLTRDTPEANRDNTEPTGTPGAFLYVPKTRTGDVAMNLRAYDTSRSAENFGTELPIVRARDFTPREEQLSLVGIPSDPRFRQRLRIYGFGPFGASLLLEVDGFNYHAEHRLEMEPNPDLFHPGYVEFSNFPVSAGPLRVTISVLSHTTSDVRPFSYWAFVSVTNNETQHITTITPRP
jgi:hypothetical protein